jgi:hypothetical protein
LLEQLWEHGIDISSGQLHNILTQRQQPFHQEKDEILTAALRHSSYIGTDDTGARHQGQNGYCTALGNELFAYFESTACKSRVNFLQVLQGARREYHINETAVAYWNKQELSDKLVSQLSQGIQTFVGEPAWQARLDELGIRGPRYTRIATEGALLGGLIARGVSKDLGILSDGAPQFDVFVHASCWVHAERPLVKMLPHNDQHRDVIDALRGQIWDLYKGLKAYRLRPEAAQAPAVAARFDALVARKTVYPNINAVLKEMRVHRGDLLRVLTRPELPLHNNAMEADIREFVKRRKISGGTRSDEGRRCRDTFASLKKTCRNHGIRFWDFLQDRIQGLASIPRLADLIRQKGTAATSQAAAVPV